MKSLLKRIEKIEILSGELGLDFYPIHFEICPSHVIHSIGAYGIPTRFNHWSFGKNFYKMNLEHELSLHRAYELVLNSNPCYAFLLEDISLVEQTIIAAHVYAHSDFFKNNIFTLNSHKDILNTMEKHKDKICRYEENFGHAQVEQVLDAAMAIGVDIISYICSHSCILDDWQRDILMMLKRERGYFVPLRETKIINEGWATFWHSKIMRMLDLCAEEFIEFAQMQGKLLQTNKFFINPYLVGFKIFSRLERELGIEKLFDIRKNERDLSFLGNYLDKDLIEALDLYLYAKRGQNWVVVEKDWEKIKDGFINSLVNGGSPVIEVVDGNHNGQGELYLHHRYDGRELDERYARKTLEFIYFLWGEKVHLETNLDNSTVLFSYPS